MKFANATKFHRKSGQGLGIDPEDDPSAVGAALNRCVIRAQPRDLQFCGLFLETFFDRGIMGLRPTQGDEKAVEGDGLQAVHNHHHHRGFSY